MINGVCVTFGVRETLTCHSAASGYGSWPSYPPPPAASWPLAGPSAPDGSYGRWTPSGSQLWTQTHKHCS